MKKKQLDDEIDTDFFKISDKGLLFINPFNDSWEEIKQPYFSEDYHFTNTNNFMKENTGIYDLYLNEHNQIPENNLTETINFQDEHKDILTSTNTIEFLNDSLLSPIGEIKCNEDDDLAPINDILESIPSNISFKTRKNADSAKANNLISNNNNLTAENNLTKIINANDKEAQQVFITLPKQLASRLFNKNQEILITSTSVLTIKLIDSWKRMPGNQDLTKEELIKIKYHFVDLFYKKKLNSIVLKKMRNNNILHLDQQPIFDEKTSAQLIGNSKKLAQVRIVAIDGHFFDSMSTLIEGSYKTFCQFIVDVIKKTRANKEFINFHPEVISEKMTDNQNIFKYKNDNITTQVKLSDSITKDMENITFRLSKDENKKLFKNGKGRDFSSLHLLTDRYTRRLLKEKKYPEEVAQSTFKSQYGSVRKKLKQIFTKQSKLTMKKGQLIWNKQIIFDKNMTSKLCLGKNKSNSVTIVKTNSIVFNEKINRNYLIHQFVKEDFCNPELIGYSDTASKMNTGYNFSDHNKSDQNINFHDSFCQADNFHSFFSNKNNNPEKKRSHESEYSENTECNKKRTKTNHN